MRPNNLTSNGRGRTCHSGAGPSCHSGEGRPGSSPGPACRSVISNLDDLARTDPVAAPLAILTAEALRSAAGGVWYEAVPDFNPAGLGDGIPLLAGATIAVNPAAIRDLLGNLSVLACSGVSGQSEAIAAIPDPLVLLEASINQDRERLAALAGETGADAGLLATLGQLAAMPLLQACGNRAETLIQGIVWDRGFCPVCAAWPAISEVRGTYRERWLHCGRCGTAWRWRHMVCAFCGNDDHETQGYLAPEAAMEARQATTCECCHGYLKSLSTLVALDPAEALFKDLSTLELDAAALDRGYTRPEQPAFALGVRPLSA